MSSLLDAARLIAVQKAVDELRHDDVLLVERLFMGPRSRFKIPKEHFAAERTTRPIVLQLPSGGEQIRRLAAVSGKTVNLQELMGKVKIVFASLLLADPKGAKDIPIYLDVQEPLQAVRDADAAGPLDHLKVECRDVGGLIIEQEPAAETQPTRHRLVEVWLKPSSRLGDFNGINFNRPT